VSRLTLSFIAAVPLVLATAGAALAKCPPGSTEEQCQGVVANIDMSGPLQAGTSTEVGFWIHEGDRPVRVTSVNMVFARVADGTVLRFEALPSGTDGRYAAQVELPAGGSWTMALEGRALEGYTFSLPLETIRVTDLPTAPATGTPVSSPAPVTVPIWLGGALVLAMLGGAIGLAAQGLRRPATA
jgi:hypothetical protein